MMIFVLCFLYFVKAETLTPEPVVELNTLDMARSLSLQLRGVVPTIDEMQQIESIGGIDEGLLNQWLDSEAFEEQVIRHHRSLFWNSAPQNDLEIRRLIFYSNGLFYLKFTSVYNRGLTRVSCTD